MARSYGNFDLQQTINLDFAEAVVEKWRSQRTGLSIVHIEYEAPIVKGNFVIRSEIFDDSGCPHTLEHLIFMGSKKYPYKGIIDRFANRGFANGTGAWTAVDSTVYTLSTAGDQGFLQLLPIYIDHLISPILTESAFVTEVYHVDHAGQDAGTVYCEMQGRENTSGDLMQLALKRLIFQEGSGYRSETGGLMNALRALDIHKIRKYHAEYYVPHNLCLIVAGKIKGGTEALLSVVQQAIEPALIEKGFDKGPHPPGWKRPFVETTSAIRKPFESKSTVVHFPSKDEKTGEMWMTFVGPKLDDYITHKAIDMLSQYLGSSVVAPINKEFVEIENPLCTGVGLWKDACTSFYNLHTYAVSIPTEHVETFDQRLRKCLEKVVDEGIDLARMHTIIRRNRRQWRSYLENSKGKAFFSTISTDFLLGPEDGSELKNALDVYRFHEELLKWTSSDWTALLKKYYIDSPTVVAYAKPSSELAERLELEEKERIAVQVKALGPEGLAKKKEEFEKAKSENETPVPDDVLKSFPVPDIESISWITVRSYQESAYTKYDGDSGLAKHICSDGPELPFFIQFDHVHSEFVEISAWLSLATLPNHLRPLMTVYEYTFFSLPIVTSTGEKLGFEEVVVKLDDETSHYTCDLGFRHSYLADNFLVVIKVEKEQYELAVQWMKDLIYGAEFDIPRIQTNCAQIMQGLHDRSRDATAVMRSYKSELMLDKSSMPRAVTIAEQASAVSELLKQIQENPEAVRETFKEIRRHMTNPSGVRFHVIGDIFKMTKPRSVWTKYFGQELRGTSLQPVRLAHETLSDMGRDPRDKAIIVSLPSIENFGANFVGRAVERPDHPDYPALHVALQALNALEGFLHIYVRGSGLAYGVWIVASTEEGTIRYILERSTNCLEAFRQAKKVVEGLVNGTVEFKDTTLDAAKSSTVYGSANEVSDSRNAAFKSFTNQALLGLSKDHHREFLAKCQGVTKDEVISVIRKYCLPLFSPASSVAVVASPPGKVEATIKGLQELGYDVEQRETDEFKLADE